MTWRKFIIPGLDPALPNFGLAGPGSRISSGDAKYVEIIHTNGGFLGFLAAIGDVDFYPNGGKRQHGCLVDPGGACSHARSYKFYAESIISEVGFHGKSCESFLRFRLGLCLNSHTSIMGGHKPLFSAHGKYYLMTNPSFPFANGPLASRSWWASRDLEGSTRLTISRQRRFWIWKLRNRKEWIRAGLNSFFPDNRLDAFTVRNFVSARSGCFEREYCSSRTQGIFIPSKPGLQIVGLPGIVLFISEEQNEVSSLPNDVSPT